MIDKNIFENPTAPYRGKPFWSWNGKLKKQELMKQIDVISEMGMGGFFCHSRTGLATEYLGDEWFSLINDCVEKGEQEGLETWLYDEDRWPSGTAGGMVTKNPEYRLNYLRLEIYNKGEYSVNGNELAVFSVDLDGYSFKNKKRIYDTSETKGNSVLVFTIEEMAKGSFYNGYTYVDTMNPDAIKHYMDITHEKYKKKTGQSFGKSIKGIFTDEPHRGAVMCSFALNNENPKFLTPYTKMLMPEIKKNYGYDLTEFLPELYLWKEGEKFHPVKWQYMETLQQLFIDNFFKPIYDWCNKNNLILTGHVLHEDNLTAQASLIGSVIRAYEYMQYPGIDVLTEGNPNYNIAKQVQSAARQFGKDWILSELYGCTGWQFDFEGHKAVGDWQALFGVNIRCHHLSWYTMEGEAKRDYPASIFHQSAWYPQYKTVEDYFSRIGVFMTGGKAVCDLMVINPVESIWSMIYPGWSQVFSMEDPDIIKLEETYTNVFRALNSARIDFDYADEDFIARMAESGTDKDGPYIKIGNSVYREILVPGCITLRKTTMDMIEKFKKAGGSIITTGRLPGYVDSIKSDRLKILEDTFHEINVFTNHLITNSGLEVKSHSGDNIADIYCQIKKDGNDYKIMILNINREESFKGVSVSIPLKGVCELWDPKTGEVTEVSRGEKIYFETDIPATGEMLLKITPESKGFPKRIIHEKVREYSAGHEFDYELTEPNVCVLDFVECEIDGKKIFQKTEILQMDRKIRKHFNLPLRGGEMLQPWFSNIESHKDVCDLKLEYSFNCEILPKEIFLAVETPEVFDISLNGKKVDKITERNWVDPCFKVLEIYPEDIQAGENTIAMSVRFNQEINLEAIYLLGDFGVKLDGIKATLISLPEKLKQGDVTTQGLPFYGAGIRYKTFADSVPEKFSDEKIYISTSDYDAACIRFVSSGEKTVFCKPYEADITDIFDEKSYIWSEYMLTRRNTFGPLHFRPLIAPGYGPDTFIAEGDLFLEDGYGLLPQGMTEPLKFIIKK